MRRTDWDANGDWPHAGMVNGRLTWTKLNIIFSTIILYEKIFFRYIKLKKNCLQLSFVFFFILTLSEGKAKRLSVNTLFEYWIILLTKIWRQQKKKKIDFGIIQWTFSLTFLSNRLFECLIKFQQYFRFKRLVRKSLYNIFFFVFYLRQLLTNADKLTAISLRASGYSFKNQLKIENGAKTVSKRAGAKTASS